MEKDKIAIAVIDDHTLFRNGVVGLMKEFTGLEVVFQSGNGLEMQTNLRKKLLPDVVLMDINMPHMDGYDSTRWLKSNFPNIKILALSMVEDEKAIFRMIKSGASGYILKESSPAELFEAIKTIHKKGYYTNELVSGKLLHSVHHHDDSPRFSERELSFLQFCCSELTYKEIADKMCVSTRTVDNYRESLFLKLNLKSRSGLILYAIQNDFFKF